MTVSVLTRGGCVALAMSFLETLAADWDDALDRLFRYLES
jgi:hypothetical protein